MVACKKAKKKVKKVAIPRKAAKPKKAFLQSPKQETQSHPVKKAKKKLPCPRKPKSPRLSKPSQSRRPNPRRPNP